MASPTKMCVFEGEWGRCAVWLCTLYSAPYTLHTPHVHLPQSLLEIIKYVKPTTLIGLSGSGPSFFQPDIEALCEGCPLPLIFPLSNPTSKAEITAEDAYAWSNGACIFASGRLCV